jgi:hypothetical protein
MGRSTGICLALGVVVAELCRAAIPSSTFTISTPDRKVYLADREGRLTAGAPDGKADYDSGPGPCRWYIQGTQIKSTVGGGYLAYDPTGKSNAVFLTTKPGSGTQWTVRLQNPPPKNECGPFGPERAAIRVGSGPKRGWYLSVEAVQENRGGGTVTVHRLVLSESPALQLQAQRIYDHK